MMTGILCPHCGGKMQIDSIQRLQPMLACPYCGRKSLMQKTDDGIHLRGIILPPAFGGTDAEGEAAAQAAERPAERVLERPFERQPERPAGERPAERPAERLFAERPAERPFGERLAEHAPERPVDHAAYAAVPPESAPAARAPGVQALTAFSTAPLTVPGASSDTPAATAAGSQPLRTETAADNWTLSAPATALLSAISAKSSGSAPVPAAQVAPMDAEPEIERHVRLARKALAAGQMLVFNSHARQAIDCDPSDPRMYVLRARLIEEAHGFARATFLSPGWAEQTPRQRGWILAQHFATLNAAVACSPESEHAGLASQAGALIARQIRDTFLEQAHLRLGKQAFRGRFRQADLRQMPLIIETCLAIDDAILPRIASQLIQAVREEMARLDPILARRLQRQGL